MEQSDNIPTWKLDGIFRSTDSDEYTAYLASCRESMTNITSLLESADAFTRKGNENFDFAAWLASFLQEYERAAAMSGTLCNYAYIVYSTDTTNPDRLNALNITIDLHNGLRASERRLALVLASHQKYMDDFYTRYPAYRDYRYLLQELADSSAHQMSASEEKLADDMQKTGGDAWERLQEQLISSMQDEKGRTFNELRGLAASADKDERREAYTKELELLRSNRIAFAACLNNLKGETLMLNGRRNWKGALDRALHSSRLSRESLEALTGAIEDSLPVWRNYFKAKAAILRKSGQTASTSAGTDGRGLAFYDLFAPLPAPGTTESDAGKAGGTNEAGKTEKAGGSLFTRTWSFEEAKDYILREYDSFSTNMGNFARTAFSSGWVDAKIRPGKVGGAYDQDFAKGHQSRILCNFTGKFGDVITMAHELGHAFHFSCMKGKSPLFFDYPMTLAETASTFAETLVKQDMIANASRADALLIIEQDLQDVAQVLVDILSRFYFEKSVFAEREKGELGADDFCRLMAEAQEKSYGDGLNEERHEYMWAVKSHYYSTGLDFYNFPYAFGQLFAAALYAKFRTEGKSFTERYEQLLADTGNMSCEDLCAKAGFDIRDKAFWKSGIDVYAQEVETLVRAYEN